MGAELFTARLRIEGKVQGVWYRGWTVDTAFELGLEGWARNCRDGSVEILCLGPLSGIEALKEKCWQGPPAASVTAVVELEVSEGDPDGLAGGGFRQVATV